MVAGNFSVGRESAGVTPVPSGSGSQGGGLTPAVGSGAAELAVGSGVATGLAGHR
jgi:hypothetical protein